MGSVVAPVTTSLRAEILHSLKFNGMEGAVGTFRQDLLQHAIRKEAAHQAYTQQKDDGAEARGQRLTNAVQSTRLTNGVTFKCRETR